MMQIQGLRSINQYISGTLCDYKYCMSKNGVPDEFPNNILRARLSALLSYLRANMLARPVSLSQRRYWKWRIAPGRDQSDGIKDDVKPDW